MSSPFQELVFDDGSSEGSSGLTLLDELEELRAVLDEDDLEETKSGETSAAGERRRRHRESMARFRRERRSRIKHMDTQLRKLHERLRRMLNWITLHRALHEANDCRCLAYADLVQAAEALMDEQYALEETLHQRQRFSRMISLESQRVEDDSEVRSAERTSMTMISELTPTGYWLQYLESESPFFYECESLESRVLSVRAGLQTITRVTDALARDAASVCVTHCLGWKAERSIERHPDSARPVLRFRFSRRVARSSASLTELLDKTWELINSTEQTARLYGSAVYSKVVQRLSEDAFINLRNSPVRSNHRRFRHFNLNVRLRAVEEDATMVLMLMLDKQPRQEQLETQFNMKDADLVEWLNDGGACLRFSLVDDDADAIEIEYVGYVACHDDDHLGHLMLECCASLLRWEHLVVPPRLLL